MAQIKIVSLRVTDEEGVEHEWEGVEGGVTVYTTYTKDDRDQKSYFRAVSAHLKIENVPPPVG
jgi:hypothetical protein